MVKSRNNVGCLFCSEFWRGTQPPGQGERPRQAPSGHDAGHQAAGALTLSGSTHETHFGGLEPSEKFPLKLMVTASSSCAILTHGSFHANVLRSESWEPAAWGARTLQTWMGTSNEATNTGQTWPRRLAGQPPLATGHRCCWNSPARPGLPLQLAPSEDGVLGRSVPLVRPGHALAAQLPGRRQDSGLPASVGCSVADYPPSPLQ